MTMQVFRTFIVVLGCLAVVLAMSPDVCLAGGSTCVDGTTLRVCVGWSQVGNPEQDVDFSVDFTDQLNPNIELSNGDSAWTVSSELLSNGNPANIGALTTPDAEHYEVALVNGANPGAVDVGSLVLVPTGDHSSSIGSGSEISGDLNGDMVLQETTGGAGGSADGFTIGGDAKGAITLPHGAGFTIEGAYAPGTISEWIDVEDITNGTMRIGSMAAAWCYVDALSNGILQIDGDIAGVGAAPQCTFVIPS